MERYLQLVFRVIDDDVACMPSQGSARSPSRSAFRQLQARRDGAEHSPVSNKWRVAPPARFGLGWIKPGLALEASIFRVELVGIKRKE